MKKKAPKKVKRSKVKKSAPAPVPAPLSSSKGTKRPVSASKPSHYVDKAELLAEIIACQAANRVSDKLAEMFGKIIEGVSHRFPNLQYYNISEDVKQDCHVLLIQKFQNFKPAKNSSCFAYFTTVIYNQMRYQLTRARRYKDHRDTMVNAVVEYMESNKGHLIDEDFSDE